MLTVKGHNRLSAIWSLETNVKAIKESTSSMYGHNRLSAIWSLETALCRPHS